ncbi:signal peptide-containing protein [Theileria equi strain WA]|uniref:Signal peptide-containing protein n=1 Tax=Theileria equi strain WA TaxID=1537102 RepID=L0B058_THEEQ|nr:signal peptide-containing protein [Theileria equi strain WA]AFZ80646.1 signal peptide-containing protein [Theileria equi strain WA]|eukprot:XP_004830312.1 signal peptide-containing protein [Theileria equi strain WA]
MKRYLVIQSLVLSLTIASLKRACAGKYKDRIPINFDISCELPFCVLTRPSIKVTSGNYYYIKRSLSTSYRIDKILDKGQVILDGDPKDLERMLFIVHLDNGQRYLRVVTKSKYRNTVERRIQEFISFPKNPKFMSVVRTHVELDIFSQSNTSIIVVIDNYQAKTKRFSIRPEMKLRYTIGVVRNFSQILNCRVQGLIERTVIMEGKGTPSIVIVSIYADGDQTVERYKSSEEKEKGFVMESRKLTEIFTQPSDEKDIYENPLSGLNITLIGSVSTPTTLNDVIIESSCMASTSASGEKQNLRAGEKRKFPEDSSETVSIESIQTHPQPIEPTKRMDCKFANVANMFTRPEERREPSTSTHTYSDPKSFEISEDDSSMHSFANSIDYQQWQYIAEGLNTTNSLEEHPPTSSTQNVTEFLDLDNQQWSYGPENIPAFDANTFQGSESNFMPMAENTVESLWMNEGANMGYTMQNQLQYTQYDGNIGYYQQWYHH